jgi:threonine synthase
LLDSYRVAMSHGWTDADYLALVARLDDAVAEIDGHGFEMTPLTRQDRLGIHLGLAPGQLWVKDDTGNVAGSHKARHLFGVMLHLGIENDNKAELSIASCGNAALAAAVVAKAANRPLRVFIPTWADPVVVAALTALGARIEVSERRSSETGDPTVARLGEAIQQGAIPFSVQGTITRTALDGGRTIGWELAEQLALARVSGTIRLLIQVGGGALAASAWQGLTDGIREQWLAADPILHTVQTEAVAPLNRAWRLLTSPPLVEAGIDATLVEAADNPATFMWPWEEVGTSAASGILDDVTYDWLPVMEATLRSGGTAHVVSESMILAANEAALSFSSIQVDPTGTAGLAALLDRNLVASIGPDERVVVLFTGAIRPS